MDVEFLIEKPDTTECAVLYSILASVTRDLRMQASLHIYDTNETLMTNSELGLYWLLSRKDSSEWAPPCNITSVGFFRE